MTKKNKNIRISAAELSEIWTCYMNDSMLVCVLKYFSNKVVDPDIRPVINKALKVSLNQLQVLEEMFKKENYPIPVGFSQEHDVDIDAPRLYTDGYFLNYIKQMAQISMNNYSMAISLTARDDIYDYFSKCFVESNQLHKMAIDVLLSKGLYIRPPYLLTPEAVEFVDSKSFLAGWFGKRRALTGLEISNLYANIQRNALGIATLLGFAQSTKSKEIKKFMMRGKDIASKHVDVFSKLMRENDLPVPMTWDTEVTENTSTVFSDKLMMFQTTALIATGLGYYGMSMATSPRRDIGVEYIQLMGEVAKYSEDGAKLMIENRWLETPPQAANRRELVDMK
ncbi:DUF3231 family protein [Halalkalibacter hemicellulosilyticus]|uniref:DUF3231 family protein n=1 Tax=Halalkalibacter hemicellulosilyticusJCM 9152 TaxID=1236971 RepID=W4QL07_9BACI|nr:DUF3231 family protein [Halalkalibacter hemicellulosilyticus]GAE32805.1 hypothetical protein JCM9152_4374 [Halalkalibacter hemicellulosilyticusJCM 9152]